MFRDIIKTSLRNFKHRFAGHVTMQQLLDRNNVKMSKTSPYDADSDAELLGRVAREQAGLVAIRTAGDNSVMYSYRFEFDNAARKRRFMAALERYPKQEWDPYIQWFDDTSYIEGKICVECQCLVPKDYLGKFRYKFEDYITRELVLKN